MYIRKHTKKKKKSEREKYKLSFIYLLMVQKYFLSSGLACVVHFGDHESWAFHMILGIYI